jgi:hypothetical protein
VVLVSELAKRHGRLILVRLFDPTFLSMWRTCMTLEMEREITRRRIQHLEYLGDDNPHFNLRSLMGAQSVFELLDYGTYQQLAWASTHLVGGTNLFTTRDAVNKVQDRELHVALTGPGDEAGRVEFEFERSPEYWKVEISVKIRNAEIGSTHDFFVDGTKLGSLTINALGKGRLDLSTSPSAGELPFVGGIPDIHIGSQIQVGSILEATVGGFNDSTDNSIRYGEVEFEMFGNNGVRGSVKLEQDPEDGGLKTEFRVRIRDTAPGQTLNVFVDDVNVGQIQVESNGRGALELSTDPNFDELPFPASFPEIQTGSVVRIDTLLNGAFTQLPNLGPNGRGTTCDEKEFQGGLNGLTAARGGARFEVALEDGGFLENKFRVHVRDAVPGSIHDISVDGIRVGEITIGGNGRAKIDFSNRMHDIRDLSLPDNFPEIRTGSTVQVGSLLSGTLNDFSPSCFQRPGFLALPEWLPSSGLLSGHPSGGTPGLVAHT